MTELKRPEQSDQDTAAQKPLRIEFVDDGMQDMQETLEMRRVWARKAEALVSLFQDQKTVDTIKATIGFDSTFKRVYDLDNGVLGIDVNDYGAIKAFRIEYDLNGIRYLLDIYEDGTVIIDIPAELHFEGNYITERESVVQEIQRFQEQVMRLKGQPEQLAADAERVPQEADQLKQALAAVRAENERLQQEVTDQKDRFVRLQEVAQKVYAENERLKTDNAAKDKQIEAATNLLIQQKQRENVQKERIGFLEGENKALRAESEQKLKEMNALETRLEQLGARENSSAETVETWFKENLPQVQLGLEESTPLKREHEEQLKKAGQLIKEKVLPVLTELHEGDTLQLTFVHGDGLEIPKLEIQYIVPGDLPRQDKQARIILWFSSDGGLGLHTMSGNKGLNSQLHLYDTSIMRDFKKLEAIEKLIQQARGEIPSDLRVLLESYADEYLKTHQDITTVNDRAVIDFTTSLAQPLSELDRQREQVSQTLALVRQRIKQEPYTDFFHMEKLLKKHITTILDKKIAEKR